MYAAATGVNAAADVAVYDTATGVKPVPDVAVYAVAAGASAGAYGDNVGAAMYDMAMGPGYSAGEPATALCDTASESAEHVVCTTATGAALESDPEFGFYVADDNVYDNLSHPGTLVLQDAPGDVDREDSYSQESPGPATEC